MIMAGLGDFRFSLNSASYDSLKRTSSYRWHKLERFEKRPARQFLGIGDDTITLSGTIYPEFKGGLEQLDKMRDMAGIGEPLELYFAFDTKKANAMGLWCVDEVEETQTYFHTNGQPRKQDFTLKISYYEK